MSAIKKRFLYCLTGAVLCIGIDIYSALSAAWHITILFAAAAIILLASTFRISKSYRSAKLICDNPILNVGMASVSGTGSDKSKSAVNVVVSGFGILLDGKPYKFGHSGVKLTAATIDRKSMTLSFGGDEKAYFVRLLHGIADRSEVYKLCDRLRYETGVAASVIGW